jgi:hypothetical protein
MTIIIGNVAYDALGSSGRPEATITRNAKTTRMTLTWFEAKGLLLSLAGLAWPTENDPLLTDARLRRAARRAYCAACRQGEWDCSANCR